MSIKTLYISHKNYDWNFPVDKILLHNKNFTKIINEIKEYNCYASFEDIGCENYSEVIYNSANIQLVDINEDYLIDINETDSYGIFHFINLAVKSNKITFPVFLTSISSRINNLLNQRDSKLPVLWTAGCSFTAGVGVGSNERYGYKLANLLNLNEIMLAKGGSSIFWAADQILRSDLKQNDFLIWGITNCCRLDYNENFYLNSMPVQGYKNLKHKFWTIDYFDSLSLTISNFKHILQVINFCNKIGVKLYLVNLLDHSLISLLLRQYKNFIDLSGTYISKKQSVAFLDYGTDNQHPGPKQHEFYAKNIYEFICKNENHCP